MFQPDLFPTAEPIRDLDLPGLLERLSLSAARPRYAFMVLNLIAKAAGTSGRVGPFVVRGNQTIPVRDWLCDALIPVAHRDHRRIAIVASVRDELARSGALPADATAAKRMVDEQLKERLKHSGRTNVSRAVTELVRAGLMTRHYQGYCVDHQNRGGQRHAVYTISPDARQALRAA